MFKKLSTAAAAAALLLSGTAHAATSSAQALSLRNAPVETRAATSSKTASNQMEGASVFFILGGIVALVAVLEITGAINIFGDDSDSN